MAEKEFLDALSSGNEVELIVESQPGKKTSRPVWFVVEGKMVYLLPVRGSDTKWYQSVLRNNQVTLGARGKKMKAKAEPLREQAQIVRVVELFRRKHGSDVQKYYSKLDSAVQVAI